MNLCCWMER